MKILTINIKRKYFDQMKNGEKKEEYRLITKYWIDRLENKEYDFIRFQNGYNRNSEKFIIEYLGVVKKEIKHEFFGNKTVQVFAIQLGDVKG